MFKDYYKQQLALLQNSAGEFAASNPSLAGLLADSANEPDTQRLMQGFAFLSANIQRELDGQFPRLLHSLTQVVAPHYLKPYPSATIVEFTPRANLIQPTVVGRYSEMETSTQDNRSVRFRTSRAITVNPLQINAAKDLREEQREGDSQRRELQVDISVQGGKLTDFELPSIEFFIDDTWSKATDIYCFLNHIVSEVAVVVDGKKVHTIPSNCLSEGGFHVDESLYPQQGLDLAVFDMLTDYFSFAEKYLFIKLDLSSWKNRPEVDRFSLVFSGPEPDFPLPEIKADHFRLHCVPAINLFSQSTEPLMVDPYQHQMLLSPAKNLSNTSPRYIYSVDEVTSLSRERSVERCTYHSINRFNAGDDQQPRYSLELKPAVNRGGYDVYITLALPKGSPDKEREVLTTNITCYSGEHAEGVNPGELCKTVGDTPELVAFRNLYAASMCCEPSLTDDRLWRVLSDMSLNLSSLNDSETLKALLKNYVPRDERNASSYQNNMRRINSICSMESVAEEILFENKLLRGLKIELTVKSQDFPSTGAYYLFGNLLNYLFAAHAPMNSYTQLQFKDFYSGALLTWPARLGTQALI